MSSSGFYFEFDEDDARYERKFIVEQHDLYALKQLILVHPANFRKIYCKRLVNNIYFDTRDLKQYQANVIGSDKRIKLRIRWYGDLQQAVQPVLEVKIKHGLLGNKLSFELPSFRLSEMQDNFTTSAYLQNADLPDDVYEVISSQIPVLINQYQRRYYASFDNHFRYTIDEDLRYFAFPNRKGQLLQEVKQLDQLILELKYPADKNSEAKEVSSQMPFRMTKHSKYVNGVDLLGVYQASERVFG